MEDGLVALLWLAFEFVLVWTGRAVIMAVSLGRWRGEQARGREGRIHSAAGSLSFIRDGRRVVTLTGLLFTGILFYVALVFLITYAATFR